MKPTDNTILITGGGSGIGRGLAEAFHARGDRVIVAARGRARLNEVVGANPGMAAYTVDMADAASIQALAEVVVRDHPDLNVLINMAGVMFAEDLRDAAEKAVADAEATIATNLLGPIRLTAALLPRLLGQADAAVVNVTSGLAFVPRASHPTYCATKAAIHSYTQSLRYQLEGTSVRVVEIVPPYVQTELMGAQQAQDPRAMPLDEYLRETVALLTEHPDAPEILVERVKAQRFAESQGEYDAFYKQFNDAVSAPTLDAMRGGGA